MGKAVLKGPREQPESQEMEGPESQQNRVSGVRLRFNCGQKVVVC